MEGKLDVVDLPYSANRIREEERLLRCQDP